MLRKTLVAAGVVAVFYIFSYGHLPIADSQSGVQDDSAATSTVIAETPVVPEPKPVSSSSHIETPDVVKAVYMTSWIASSDRRNKLVSMIDETELNAIVIDVKDDTGRVSYDSKDPAVLEAGSVEVRIRDLDEFIKELHEKGIYVIARVAVFQDPYLATRWTDEAVQSSMGGVWKDRKGLSWIDASSKKYHKYISALAKDAYSHGFDEINFDYVRFPTDGTVSTMTFPRSGERDRADVMEDFFKYINAEMNEAGIPSSVDVFGLVTSSVDDMGIGQVLEVALEHFDFVCPMVYPSHFADGSFGYSDPNAYPGEIIAKSMGDAVRRAEAMAVEVLTATSSQTVGTTTTITKATYKADSKKAAALKNKLRPWFQDFDYGDDYSAADVRAQIDASEALGLDSWFLWDPSVVYTREALKSE